MLATTRSGGKTVEILLVVVLLILFLSLGGGMLAFVVAVVYAQILAMSVITLFTEGTLLPSVPFILAAAIFIGVGLHYVRDFIFWLREREEE